MGGAQAPAPGTRLGRYEILRLLDSGGMGDVYRARDPELGRDVAIKMLRESGVTDAARLRRFEIEARAAGALDHPNVLVVYDVGRHEGAPYLVSELLEGETLRERLSAAGALPPREALDRAAQTARGLAAAHAKGIVHRDLKPKNLFVTRDGRVKILDFGLVKLVQPPGDEETTLSAEMRTGSGVVLGTVGYMAPEQARGEPVGPAGDIFSLGIVTYEMLAGKPPFRRGTSAETLAAILNDDPPALSAPVPPALEWVVRRCLEKRPEDRFQSAHDLSLALEALASESGPISGRAPAPKGSSLSRRQLLTGGAAVGLLGAGAGVGISALVPGDARRRATPSYQRVTFRRGMIRTARFGPDYETILYGALWGGDVCRVYTVRPENPESAALNLPPATPLAVSPSGELALALGTHFRGIMTYGTLARVPLVGGAPRELLEGVKYADWSRDGSELAVVRRVSGRERLEFPAGNVVAEPPEPGGGFSFPRVSPAGDRVAFFELTQAEGLVGSVGVADRSGRKEIVSRQYFNVFGLAWNANDIWFTAAGERPLFRDALHAVTTEGGARLVARIPGNASLHDVSPDGVILMARTDDRSGITVLAPGAAEERDLSWLDASFLVDISRDGSAVLFTEAGVGGGPRGSVYLRSTDGSPAVRLGDGRAVALSPDGRWALAAAADGPSPYLELLPTGPGRLRRIEHPGFVYSSVRWLAGGRRVLVRARDRDRGPRLYVLDLDGGALEPVTPPGLGVGSSWTPSPDGKTVAIGFDRRVELHPLSDGEPRSVPRLGPGDRLLAWIDDGLLVSAEPNPQALGRIFLVDPASGAREIWKEIQPRDPAGMMNMRALVVTPDGSSYGYGWHRALSDLYLVEGWS